jgi:hypothetical protein
MEVNGTPMKVKTHKEMLAGSEDVGGKRSVKAEKPKNKNVS